MCVHLPGQVQLGFLSMMTLYTFPVDPKTAKCLESVGVNEEELDVSDLSS